MKETKKEKEKTKPIKILLIEDDFYTCQLYQDIFSFFVSSIIVKVK